MKPIGRDQQRFDIIIRVGIDHRYAGGELSDLAGELTPSVAHDLRRAAKAVARSHRQRAFQHHEHARRPLSRREQPLTAAVLPTFAKPLDAQDVSLAEHGKGLIAAPPITLSYGFTWICLSSCIRQMFAWAAHQAARRAKIQFGPPSRALRNGGEEKAEAFGHREVREDGVAQTRVRKLRHHRGLVAHLVEACSPVREGSLADNFAISCDEADLMGLARPVDADEKSNIGTHDATSRTCAGHRDADQSLYWRSWRNSPLDLHRGQPAGAHVPQVLTAQGAKGRSRQAGPSGQSTNKTSSEHVKGTGGAVAERLLPQTLQRRALPCGPC